MVVIESPTLSETELSSLNDVILTATITDDEDLQVKYSVFVNGVYKDSSMVLIDSPIELEYIVRFSDLKLGENEIVLEVANANNETATWSGTITLQERDAIINITYPSMTVPKDTAIEFPFEIKAPFYLNKEVTRNVEVIDNGNLGNGKMFTIDIAPLKPIFKNIKDVVIELRR